MIAVGRVDGEQAAVVQDGDPLGEAGHDLHVVLDHQHRPAFVGVHGADQLDELGDVLHRDAGHRLVEQDHARLAREQHRELELALVAVRELARGDDAPRRRARRAPAPSRRAPAPRGRARARRQIRIVPPSAASAARRAFSRTSSSGKTFDTWKVRPIPARVRRNGGRAVMSTPSSSTRPVVGRSRPEMQVEQRRLAGPVRADHGEQLSLADLEPDIGDDRRAADDEPEVLVARIGDALTRWSY